MKANYKDLFLIHKAMLDATKEAYKSGIDNVLRIVDDIEVIALLKRVDKDMLDPIAAKNMPVYSANTIRDICQRLKDSIDKK